MKIADLFRVYAPEECGEDGYPFAWHGKQLVDDLGIGVLTLRGGVPAIKDMVREDAGNRCVRCGHPYSKGDGEWSPCDLHCTHSGPYRVLLAGEWYPGEFGADGLRAPRLHLIAGNPVDAQWRILTVHHLNGVKADCRWWNLASLCQRCHLRVQRVVVMERVWPWQHSDWFKPYVAGYYASVYLGEEISREQAVERMGELLALEQVVA